MDQLKQQLSNHSTLNPESLIKAIRAKVEQENIKIADELGLTTERLLSEIKTEIDKVIRIMYSHKTKPEARKELFDYESYLYSFTQDIENGFPNCLEIQNNYKEVKRITKVF